MQQQHQFTVYQYMYLICTVYRLRNDTKLLIKSFMFALCFNKKSGMLHDEADIGKHSQSYQLTFIKEPSNQLWIVFSNFKVN